jgi:hypothetical protein
VRVRHSVAPAEGTGKLRSSLPNRNAISRIRSAATRTTQAFRQHGWAWPRDSPQKRRVCHWHVHCVSHAIDQPIEKSFSRGKEAPCSL